MANFCLATGVSPRDYPYLTNLEKNEFIKAVNKANKKK